METMNAIAARRSVRRFTDEPLPDETMRSLLKAAALAPSGKNKQPWRFTVVRADKRERMVEIMRAGIDSAKSEGENPGSAEWTLKVMAQAPVTVFVFNPSGAAPWEKHSVDQMFEDVVDIQSAGAAIQNMLLAAVELGLGSLWICDVFYAYEGLRDFLGETGELIAAVSFGHPAESPEARPRKPESETIRFL